MIKLIASDLDGTIIDKSGLIYETNLKAINDINNKKIDFVVCTGKTYPIIKGLCSKFNAKYGIFGNGNQIIDLKTGKEIYKKLLNKEEILSCIKIAKKNNLHVHAYTDKSIISEKLEYMDLRNFKLKTNNLYNSSSLDFTIVNDLSTFISNNDIEICKLVISNTSSLEKIKNEIVNTTDVDITTIKKYGEYKDTIINKEYEYLDITPKNISKDNALKILQIYLNITSDETMAIGDNLNDLGMVKNCKYGISVANGYDELKQVAKYITKNPVETGGFAEAIYKFIEF